MAKYKFKKGDKPKEETPAEAKAEATAAKGKKNPKAEKRYGPKAVGRD